MTNEDDLKFFHNSGANERLLAGETVLLNEDMSLAGYINADGFKTKGNEKYLGPAVPGGHPILEVELRFSLVYARNKNGWYWYCEEEQLWRKV